MNTLFQKVVLGRLWLTFIVLGFSFAGFAAGTVDLAFLFMANARLLQQYGWQAVMDGGLQQLVELLIKGAFSLAAYIVFKTCEHRLSDWLGHGSKAPAHPREDDATDSSQAA